MRLRSLFSARRLAALLVLVTVAATGLLLAPALRDQEARAATWVQTAYDATAYDAEDHLRAIAAAGTWPALVTQEAADPLAVLAADLAETRPEGSLPDQASACREATDDLWWPAAAEDAAASCDQLERQAAAGARLEVLTAFAEAVAQQCGRDAEGYPMTEHYPYRTPATADALEELDALLSTGPGRCLDPSAGE